MTRDTAARQRSWLVPEVVQTSSMDCGPATLKALVGGFGIQVSYGRLREVCQTDVDGTSMNSLEDVANSLGLRAEQTVLPRDHVLLPEAQALPAIAVLVSAGYKHFVVAWRKVGSYVMVMDPEVGRRWVHQRTFLASLYIHSQTLPADEWRSWAGSGANRCVLHARMRGLGVARAAIAALLAQAHADPSWQGCAILDGAIRQVDRLIAAGGLRAGAEAERTLQALVHEAIAQGDAAAISAPYRAVVPAAEPAAEPAASGENLVLRGAVLLCASRRSEPEAPAAARSRLDAALLGVLREAAPRPARTLLGMIRADGLLAPLALAAQILLATLAVLVEALLFRAALEIERYVLPGGPRLGALLAGLVFFAAVGALEIPINLGVLRSGRKLEARLRMAYLTKIPRVIDHYFGSRPVSDMAERGHLLHATRTLPLLAARCFRAGSALLAVAAAIVWRDPSALPWVLLLASSSLGLPFLLYPFLRERDLRLRTFEGALMRFYLDALRGLTAIRAHGAERSVRSEHASLLAEWGRSARGLAEFQVFADALVTALGIGLSIGLVAHHLAQAGDRAGVILVVWWALQIPVFGDELAQIARHYPRLRSVMLRVLEVLGAPEDDPQRLAANPAQDATTRPPGSAELVFERVGARAGGHEILADLELRIPAGQHVAIVGPSGAGKSTLLGLLLGWHRPAEGRIRVDGAELAGAELARLRARIAWVDPSVALWNRSLLENLRYGAQPRESGDWAGAIRDARLEEVIDRLPRGLQTELGEGGALVSGGEGQRVRFGRALVRREAGLVLLDEPFRGLEREQRAELLMRARALWGSATLLCVTHDVGEAVSFDRVLVIERGRVAEDGIPTKLLAQQGSRYRALVEAEKQVRTEVWQSAGWQRWELAGGQIAGRDRG